MTEFDDMTKRILDKLDSIESNIDDICRRLLEVEIELKNHFKSLEKKQRGKDRRFYIIIAAMGIIFTVVQVLQSAI